MTTNVITSDDASAQVEYKIKYHSSQGMLCVINYSIHRKNGDEWSHVETKYGLQEAKEYVASQNGKLVSSPDMY